MRIQIFYKALKNMHNPTQPNLTQLGRFLHMWWVGVSQPNKAQLSWKDPSTWSIHTPNYT